MFVLTANGNPLLVAADQIKPSVEYDIVFPLDTALVPTTQNLLPSKVSPFTSLITELPFVDADQVIPSLEYPNLLLELPPATKSGTGVGEGVKVGVILGVMVFVGVIEGVGVKVDVAVIEGVGVGVSVFVGVCVVVGVCVLVGVCVGVPVFVGVMEGVGVGDAVFDGVGVIPSPFL